MSSPKQKEKERAKSNVGTGLDVDGRERHELTTADIGTLPVSAVPSFLTKPQEEDVFALAIKDQPHDDTCKIPIVKIDHDNGKFTLGHAGAAAVLVGYPIFHYQTRGWWSRGYQEGQTDPPECVSYDMIKPSSSSTSKQSSMCALCKWAKFGSAAVGKGQACRAITYVFVANPDYGEPPLVCLMLPPSSIACYLGGLRSTGYVDAAKHFKTEHGREARHHELVWTQFALEPGGTKHYEIVCKPLSVAQGKAEIEAIAGIRGKFMDAMRLLQTDPAAIAEAGKDVTA